MKMEKEPTQVSDTNSTIFIGINLANRISHLFLKTIKFY